MGMQQFIDDVVVLSLFNKGLGLRRISRETGYSRSGIGKSLKRSGVSGNHRSHLKRIDRGFCLKCKNPLVVVHQKKFCSNACSNSVNTKGQVRNKLGVPRRKRVHQCQRCGNETKNLKFCSKHCFSESVSKYPGSGKERKRLKNLVTVRRYQARKINQTPPDADHDLIILIYANCPEGYEVDHRIPLSKGGMHHQDNLQYLLMVENRRKGNKLPNELFEPVAELVDGI